MFYVLPDEGITHSSEEWAALVASTGHRVKAPVSWVEAQGLKGRPPVAAYSIWAKYPLERKISIWLMSSEEDFRRAGYIKGANA